MKLAGIIEKIEELSTNEQIAVFSAFDGVIETHEEKIGVAYSLEAFKECTTLEAFKDKYLEVERRSFNFMKS
jgi:hypothetical protein